MKLYSDEVKLESENFNIHNGTIFYKNYSLWKTIDENLNKYNFAYYDPTLTKYPEDDPAYYMLVCIDAFGDRYHYGQWDTKEQLNAWLKEPCEDSDFQKLMYKLFLMNKLL